MSFEDEELLTVLNVPNAHSVVITAGSDVCAVRRPSHAAHDVSVSFEQVRVSVQVIHVVESHAYRTGYRQHVPIR